MEDQKILQSMYFDCNEFGYFDNSTLAYLSTTLSSMLQQTQIPPNHSGGYLRRRMRGTGWPDRRMRFDSSRRGEGGSISGDDPVRMGGPICDTFVESYICGMPVYIAGVEALYGV